MVLGVPLHGLGKTVSSDSVGVPRICLRSRKGSFIVAYMDFIEMYARDVKKTPEILLSETPLSFPVSTNNRGVAFASLLDQRFDVDFRNIRALDVGCAYGGYALALADRGAQVVGIDVSPKLIEYAKANASGVYDIRFEVHDAAGSSLRRAFPPKSFNLVILNDVLEHIYDTTTLFETLDYLLDDDGAVYFKVPNGMSPRFILSEGHRKIFALTLLDPDCWFYLYPKRASIFYRPFPYFVALFSHFGFKQMELFDDEDVLRRFTAQKIRRQIKSIFEKSRDFAYPGADIARLARERIVKFRDDFDNDVATRSDDFVKLKYGSYFFTGAAARRESAFRPKQRLIVESFPPLAVRSPEEVELDQDVA